MAIQRNEKGQAVAGETKHIERAAFDPMEYTEIRWLGGSGAMINSRGTTVMVDPVLSGFDMPLLIQVPITEEEIPHLDAILLTHCDNDHYSRSTCRALKGVTVGYHGPRYVADLLKEELGIKGCGHDIGERFQVGNMNVSLTPAWHNWQNESPKHHTREFAMEDYCGFWIDTPDGSVWAVGDSRLLEDQLRMPVPDAMLFDFSDSRWHIGMEGAVRMAAAYPDTPLILWHWGSVDAPEWKEFNGDPDKLRARVVNPQRVVVLDPGQAYRLKRLPKKG
ncbi:MAG: MBL fold metallo-hydrolase [Hungatella sp.]|jgi:L-ascorbate metabolism protein UlaG (beta-lactamase superfamily)|nr:MBL fold metallo-hydrolase [Hungatella sp.]